MRRIRNIGDQKKGSVRPNGEESLTAAWSPPHHISFLIVSTILFSMMGTENVDISDDEEIKKKIREWDLKFIQGTISEEEYLERLNKLSSSQD